MINPEKDISNFEFPISNVIREAFRDLPQPRQLEVMENMNVEEFVSYRVDVYLQALETAMHAGYDELGAKEIALRECLTGLLDEA